MTKHPIDSGELSLQPRRAPPVGRVLRILLGLALLVYALPPYFRVPVPVTVSSLLLILGLVCVYSIIHVVVSRCIIAFRPALGAVMAVAPLAVLYFAGSSRLPIIGQGKGQLAAVTFLGLSLVVAGVRAIPGCEVMAIPEFLFGKDAEMPCLIFSPLDKLERNLRNKRGV